jgi:hypothetical protein
MSQTALVDVIQHVTFDDDQRKFFLGACSRMSDEQAAKCLDLLSVAAESAGKLAARYRKKMNFANVSQVHGAPSLKAHEAPTSKDWSLHKQRTLLINTRQQHNTTKQRQMRIGNTCLATQENTYSSGAVCKLYVVEVSPNNYRGPSIQLIWRFWYKKIKRNQGCVFHEIQKEYGVIANNVFSIKGSASKAILSVSAGGFLSGDSVPVCRRHAGGLAKALPEGWTNLLNPNMVIHSLLEPPSFSVIPVSSHSPYHRFNPGRTNDAPVLGINS